MPNPYIILVEDDPTDEFFFERVWQKMGAPAPLMVLRDGSELVAAFDEISKSPGKSPCLIILDSVVQPLTTAEISAAVRGLPTEIPLLVLSGADDSPLEASLAGSRLIGALRKPITVELLQAAIKKCCPEIMSGA